jgi:hypothetical protein
MSDNIIRPDAWLKNGVESLHRTREAEGRLEGGGDGPQGPNMEQRVAALEADMKDVKAGIGRLETAAAKTDSRLDKLDDRLRSLEIASGKVDGKLDLLVAKMPSWWQQPVTAAAIVALMAAAVALGKASGVLH